MEPLLCFPAKSDEGGERRKSCLSEADVDYIAEKAAEKAVEKMTAQIYQEIGKSFVTRFLYIAGVTVVGVYLYLKSKGIV